jgi:hypothetical protein
MGSILNRRNAVVGWLAWRVVKRTLRRTAARHERARRAGAWGAVGLLAAGAVAAAAAGFMRRSQ